MKLEFPKNFLWGTATSAHQVEGGLVNDWSEWEGSQSRIKNYELRTGKNFDPEIFVSGKACDSFNRFDDDLECLKKINANSYRFSIDWSRVEPAEGKWSEEGLNYYRDIIRKLKENNIEPFVTLWHWPLPLWLRDKGGWENKNTIKYFSILVEKIVSELDAKFWITENEIDNYAGLSYLKGKWPPQKKCPRLYLKVLHNLINAHIKAYKIIKKIKPEAQVGLAKFNVYFEAYQGRFINKLIKKLADWWWNFYILNKINNYQDFIGLNQYRHNRINYGFNKNENKVVSDFGWELYPESIYHCLVDLKKYNKPIYITEHGLADAADKYRSWFIIESLKNVNRAIKEGADVRGYFHWSLLDNFEWADGYTMKFGLFEVDRKTFQRTLRPSASVYGEICRNNTLTI